MASFLGKSAKALFGVEIVVLAGAYGVFHGLNTSPAFRVRTADVAPFIVEGFYKFADSVSSGGGELARQQDAEHRKRTGQGTSSS
mmetsp:Transcript_3346/g.7907  ORF Transcript_3346/g.7907 Transcript_3346/m.7907 type:complete len:85 (-) Transcript_3346:95-349(-)